MPEWLMWTFFIAWVVLAIFLVLAWSYEFTRKK